ncbi:uncharacterized protein FIBRA_03428 [Fibroporia radiculosa]|uniref:Ribosome biogenesis protein YTM1 n=1 Tax=Fibroporia radiculosa TaxID=599839 RepID=J4G5H6_9APHY|nr:uncharacterized protein FIBRA_03428 [Fibroporia radiculosa]CCM01378.1 predicted protein [Fibroporia radiculosa]
MASTSASPSEISHPVVFTTQTPYPLPSQKFMIPTSWRRYQLSQLVNRALSLPSPIPFDFLVHGEILRGTLTEWCAEKGIGEEEMLEIEYFESVMPPQKMSDLPHEDWVSSVSCALPGHFLTASYDGHLRVFNYSQKLLYTSAVHMAPITSICVIPSSSSASSPTLLASASHDLTARLSTLSCPSDSPDSSVQVQVIASLHLHTASISSVSANSVGSHLLTSSWDDLIGLWDTSVPTTDEVPPEDVDRKKRRKVDEQASRPKRKAPLSVLKSHTARVSRAIFGTSEEAYSCGFDSTIRSWDVENGVCTNTITASAKPFLDLALTQSRTVLAASTDRTVSQYDLRASTASATTPSTATLRHSATPSCIVVPSTSNSSVDTSSEHQLLTGAYDGIVRLWDLRSVKSAVTSFKAWEGTEKTGKKVLSIDWARGIVGVGGEGGVEVWRLGQGGRAIPS